MGWWPWCCCGEEGNDCGGFVITVCDSKTAPKNLTLVLDGIAGTFLDCGCDVLNGTFVLPYTSNEASACFYFDTLIWPCFPTGGSSHYIQLSLNGFSGPLRAIIQVRVNVARVFPSDHDITFQSDVLGTPPLDCRELGNVELDVVDNDTDCDLSSLSATVEAT